MESIDETREEIIARFAHLSRYRKHFDRAVDTVLEGAVKRHLFSPSGRVLYTVVGRSGDEFIDAEKPFCSCAHYFFRVLGGRDQICYHLLAHEIARESGLYHEVEFDDSEFGTFVELLTLDLLTRATDMQSRQS